MNKSTSHHAKKMAKLRYQDEILALHTEGMSIRDITTKINHKLIQTDLKTSLSKSTIATIIKNIKEKRND